MDIHLTDDLDSNAKSLYWWVDLCLVPLIRKGRN